MSLETMGKYTLNNSGGRRFYAQDHTLGWRIQSIRKMYKLSQTEFAKLLGVTKQSVSKWESDGIANIDAKVLLKLEELSGYHCRWILLGEGEAREKRAIHPRLSAIDRILERFPPQKYEAAMALIEHLVAHLNQL